jgi:hypothetical protein
MLAITMAVFHWYGIIDWRMMCGCRRGGMFHDGLASVLEHPGDVDVSAASLEPVEKEHVEELSLERSHEQ